MANEGKNALTESTFFILLSLAEGPRHGYAIMREAEELSDGRVKLSTGTLYGAIKRLLDEGWIRRAADPEPQGNNRERFAYNLTAEGRRILDAEARRLESLVKILRKRAAGKEA